MRRPSRSFFWLVPQNIGWWVGPVLPPSRSCGESGNGLRISWRFLVDARDVLAALVVMYDIIVALPNVKVAFCYDEGKVRP